MKVLNLVPVKNPGKMSSYWKKEWRVVALILITGTLFNGAMSIGPILQGKIIDQLLAGRPTADVVLAVARFVLVVALIQAIRFLKRYYVRLFANRTGATMRMMVYNNIIHKDIADLRDEKTGDLMTKVTSDVDACVEGMRKFTTEVFDTGVLMVSYLVTMLAYDFKLTALSCLLIPVAMVLAESLKKFVFKFTKAYRIQLSEVSNLTYETASNAMLYRINSAEQDNLDKYGVELERLEKKAILANVLENSMQPVYSVIAIGGVVSIVYFGGKNVLSGLWSVGQFSAYLTLFSALAVKASKAAKLFNSVQKAQVSWRRIRPYLTGYQLASKAAPPVSGDTVLQVDSLSFTYPSAMKETIDSVSFAAKTGQLIGLTGPVASGKSTVGLALQGVYPYGGSILLNGNELRNLPRAEISRLISYMGHDSQLLSDTIYNNITLGEEGSVQPVLHDVCFDRDLEGMALGVKTVVGASGVRLSGGQQARLALARALYHKSSVLVLDDPFSAVDMRTEQEIITNLKNHYSDRVIILISHRVACFEAADSVVLVKDGRSVCGTHSQLMESSSVYRAIFTLQKEGEADE